jgi:hypothetical protein
VGGGGKFVEKKKRGKKRRPVCPVCKEADEIESIAKALKNGQLLTFMNS